MGGHGTGGSADFQIPGERTSLCAGGRHRRGRLRLVHRPRHRQFHRRTGSIPPAAVFRAGICAPGVRPGTILQLGARRTGDQLFHLPRDEAGGTGIPQPIQPGAGGYLHPAGEKKLRIPHRPADQAEGYRQSGGGILQLPGMVSGPGAAGGNADFPL